MATITPNISVNASLASPLITPGYPMVAVPKSNPNADQEQAAAIAGKSVAAVRDAALVQSGHIADRTI